MDYREYIGYTVIWIDGTKRIPACLDAVTEVQGRPTFYVSWTDEDGEHYKSRTANSVEETLEGLEIY